MAAAPSSLRRFVAEPALSAAEGSLPLVKLADFGLARMVTAQTRVTLGDSILGTPEYMSPEQARGDEHLDHRTDLYSAGVVLYEMLTGRTPFRADTPSAVIHQILNVDPPEPRTFNKDVDPAMASLSLRLMAKEPDDRFASAAEVIDALDTAEQVSSLERRRRVRRRLLAGVSAVVILMGCTWLWSQFSNRSVEGVATSRPTPRIVDVWKGDPDTTNVWAKYADGTEEVFHEFPAEPKDRVSAVECVTDGNGCQVVVAALAQTLDPDGSVLIAFDARGEERWRIALHSERVWPDCDPAERWWNATHLAGGDLDGRPGEELVVEAHDQPEYPTRLSIVDPRDGTVRSTFWHFGHIHGLRAVPEFFDDERPAILAWGVNNKLDGFGLPFPPRPYEPNDGEDMSRTDWDIVAVVMILDPTDMEGLGPPRTSRIPEIAPARPWAYAFFDLPHSREMRRVPNPRTTTRPGSPAHGSLEHMASIEKMRDAFTRSEEATAPWFNLNITAMTSDGRSIEPPTLVLDRNFELRGILPANHPEREVAKKEYWDRFWHVIVREGRYVDD